jgi:hypothetical protein
MIRPTSRHAIPLNKNNGSARLIPTRFATTPDSELLELGEHELTTALSEKRSRGHAAAPFLSLLKHHREYAESIFGPNWIILKGSFSET